MRRWVAGGFLIVAAVAVACSSFSDDATTPINTKDAGSTPAVVDAAGSPQSTDGGVGVPDARADAAEGVAITPYVNAILADDPVAYWRMSSPNNDPITNVVAGGPSIVLENGITNPAQSTPFPNPPDSDDGALIFNDETADWAVQGATDYHFEGSTDFTIEVWLRGFTGTSYTILGAAVANDVAINGYVVGVEPQTNSGGALTFRYGSGTEGAVVVGPEPDHPNWHDYAFVVSAGGIFVTFYTDGVMTVAGALTGADGNPVHPTTHSQAFTIGGMPGFATEGTNFPYVGALDEVAIYDYALTADQLVTHVTAAAKAH